MKLYKANLHTKVLIKPPVNGCYAIFFLNRHKVN